MPNKSGYETVIIAQILGLKYKQILLNLMQNKENSSSGDKLNKG